MENNTIPTAEEFLKEYIDEEIYNAPFFAYVNGENIVHQAMIDFATIHVKLALQLASKKALIGYGTDDEGNQKTGNPVWSDDYKYDSFDMLPTMTIKESSILNAYPETLIK